MYAIISRKRSWRHDADILGRLEKNNFTQITVKKIETEENLTHLCMRLIIS